LVTVKFAPEFVEWLNFLCGTLATEEFESLNTGGHIAACNP